MHACMPALRCAAGCWLCLQGRARSDNVQEWVAITRPDYARTLLGGQSLQGVLPPQTPDYTAKKYVCVYTCRGAAAAAAAALVCMDAWCSVRQALGYHPPLRKASCTVHGPSPGGAQPDGGCAAQRCVWQ